MSFTIQRDVGGVGGLLLATNVFSEDFERRLFHHPILFPPPNPAARERQTDGAIGPSSFPKEVT